MRRTTRNTIPKRKKITSADSPEAAKKFRAAAAIVLKENYQLFKRLENK